MPFWVSPEQVVQEKAEFARKGIARGRSLTALTFDDGVLLCAENASRTLRKISEIYDRIAFGGVGRYNEFDQLRIAGVRHADLKGFTYSREDVDARSLANQYAQLLGTIFTHEMKPMEVELLVAEVGTDPSGDQLYHVLYDGTVVDEENFSALGGDAEAVLDRLRQAWQPGLDLPGAMTAAATALSGPTRSLGPADLEAAVLARDGARRSFRRLDDEQLTGLLPGPEPPTADAAGAAATGAAGATEGQADAPADQPAEEGPSGNGPARPPPENT
jgi:proteasome alpha subunit